MAERFELLVFDWDGTVSDSESRIVAAMQEAIQEMALSDRDDNAVREIIGLSLDEAIIVLYPDMEARNRHLLAEQYRLNYLAASPECTPLFPGTKKVISALHNAGYLLAVATGKSRRGLDRSLRENNLGDYFHASRCADETFSKPHPQMLRDLMQILNVAPSKTLMIGDSEYDLRMAMNAEVDSLAVSYGVHPPERLLKFNPLACLDSLNELPVWLGMDVAES
jgi:phosphoglycolate phosphatase